MQNHYTGVYIVPTPADKQSGVSHLVEHLCFRGSEKYPADHELFVINSLLPAKINASTEAGYTYFFVTSHCLNLFIECLNYLYQGLTQYHYADNVVVLEKEGVITQELAFYEHNTDYFENAEIRKGDTSPFAYLHAGGFSDTIKKLTQKEVMTYKRKWYSAQNITLMTNKLPQNVTDTIRQKIPNISLNPKTVTPALINYPVNNSPLNKITSLEVASHHSPLSILDQTSTLKKGDLTILTCWLPNTFLSSVSEVQEILINDMKTYGKLYIDKELNQYNQFAIRIVLRQLTLKADASTKLIVLIGEHCQPSFLLPNDLPSFHSSKHPVAVVELINQFKRLSHINHITEKLDNVEKNRKNSLPLMFSLSKKGNICNVNFAQLLPNRQHNRASFFANHYSHHLSLTHLPSLPKMFRSWMNCFGKNNFQQREANWLYKITVKNLNLSLMLSENFWSPRIDGQCYGYGLAQFESQFYLFGVEDSAIKTRLDWCESLFTE